MDGGSNAWAKPTIAEVQKVICAAKGLTIADMKTKLRVHRLAHPRQVAMALAREMTGASYPKLGQHFGGRDHTTVLFACRKIARAAATNPQLEIKLARYRERIMELVASRPAPPPVEVKASEGDATDWHPKPPRRPKLALPKRTPVLDLDAWRSLGGELEEAA